MSWNTYWASSAGNTMLIALHVVCVMVALGAIMKAGGWVARKWPKVEPFVGVGGLLAVGSTVAAVVLGLSGAVGLHGEVRAWHVFDRGVTVVFDAQSRKVPVFDTTLVFVPSVQGVSRRVWRARKAPSALELDHMGMLHVRSHKGHTIMLDAQTFEHQGSLSDILQERLNGQRFQITSTSTRGVEAVTKDGARRSFTYAQLFPDRQAPEGSVRTMAPDHQCRLSTSLPYEVERRGSMHHVSELRRCGLDGVLSMHRGAPAPGSDVLVSWQTGDAIEAAWTLNLSEHIDGIKRADIFPMARAPEDTHLRFFVLVNEYGLWEGRVRLEDGHLLKLEPLA